jgi:hypothetical protein
MEQSAGLIKNCVGSYRIPEPVRQVNQQANKIELPARKILSHNLRYFSSPVMIS